MGGVQPKIVLVRTDDGWAQALGGHPSTHILKPALTGRNASVIHDEEYGSRLARALDLAQFSTSIEDFDGLPTLVVERYDRKGGERVHQEDFSQALGAAGSEKYQEFGGIVSLKRIAQVLVRVGAGKELTNFARMMALAVACGNLDLHAKNLALLHPEDGSVRLAPAYDVVPQTHHSGSDGRLALSVNGQYRHVEVTREDLVAEASSWGSESRRSRLARRSMPSCGPHVNKFPYPKRTRPSRRTSSDSPRTSSLVARSGNRKVPTDDTTRVALLLEPPEPLQRRHREGIAQLL